MNNLMRQGASYRCVGAFVMHFTGAGPSRAKLGWRLRWPLYIRGPRAPFAPASSASLRTVRPATSASCSFGASLPLVLVLWPGNAPPRASVTLLNNSLLKLLTPWPLAKCSAMAARRVRSQIHRSATSARTALELFEIEVPAERHRARPQGNLPINQYRSCAC